MITTVYCVKTSLTFTSKVTLPVSPVFKRVNIKSTFPSSESFKTTLSEESPVIDFIVSSACAKLISTFVTLETETCQLFLMFETISPSTVLATFTTPILGLLENVAGELKKSSKVFDFLCPSASVFNVAEIYSVFDGFSSSPSGVG